MASLPSPLTRLEDLESKLKALSNDLQHDEAKKTPESLPTTVLKAIQSMEIGAMETDKIKQLPVSSPVPLPAKYKVQTSDSKPVVQYVYASPRDPKDESIPAHVRERYKEIEKERQLGFPAVSTSVTAPDSKPPIASSNTTPVTVRKLVRPASANTERTPSPSYGRSRQRTYKSGSNTQGTSPVRPGPKSKIASATDARSSNAIESSKQNRSRSHSRTSAGSPRRRRPFSIAADSTSDTEPIENQLSLDAIKHSPPRIARNRQVRRQQYLATKFKLAARFSKQTQTIAPALSGLSLDESSGSATTVISRHQSVTQTNLAKQGLQLTSSQPDCHITHTEKNSALAYNEKPPISPTRDKTSESKEIEEKTDSLEWRRARVRLRSTAGSPSPPPGGGGQRVPSASIMQRSTGDVTALATVDRPASAQGHISLKTRPNSEGQLITPVQDKHMTSSATQIDICQTKNTGVQVKIKKRKKHGKRSTSVKSLSQRSASHRSVSQKSIESKHSVKSKQNDGQEGAGKNAVKKKKKKRKVKSVKSRDQSVKSVLSGRSLQSHSLSASKSKHVQISPRPSYHKAKRSASVGTNPDGSKKNKKKKKSLPSSQIARFLRQLSRDKEAIKIINKMAVVAKKK